jgi:hypothetical protein
MPRPPRAPLQSRSRKRWVAVAGIAVLWALFVHSSGSIAAGTVLLLMLAAAVIGLVIALRYLGINGSHPWVQALASRPWRDGRDVLQLSLRHLSEVLIVTPGGSLLAPNQVELRINPGDLASLTDLMDIDLINSSATEVYEAQIAARGAGLASAGPVGVCVMGDPAVPAGRYQLKQGRPASPSQSYAQPPSYAEPQSFAQPQPYPRPQPYPQFQPQPAAPAVAYAGGGRVNGHTRAELPTPSLDLAGAQTVVADSATITAVAPVPLLRLVTRGSVAETRISGARAGRGTDVELRLPEEPTVSRVHAELTFTDGRWQIINLGRNGVTLNGTPLTGEHTIRDGDSIGWGTQPGALMSRVEIGWDKPLPAHG